MSVAVRHRWFVREMVVPKNNYYRVGSEGDTPLNTN